MAKTPYVDLTTEDILSAHVSGLAHSVNKIEEVLNMKTKDAVGISLKAVANQDDVSLQYRIYEGDIRNWTKAVIKRNGAIVPETEYVIQLAFGVIVFHSAQSSSDVVSADATHIEAASTRLESIEGDASGLAGKVSTVESESATLKSDVATLKKDVDELKAGGGTTNPPVTPPSGAGDGYGQLFPLSNNQSTWINVMPGFTEANLSASVNVTQSATKIDAFPIFVQSRTEVSVMSIKASIGTGAGNIILGIYKDVNAQPKELIASTASKAIVANGVNRLPLTEGKVILDVGVYWLARYQTTGIKVDGHAWNKNFHINIVPQPASFMDGTGDPVGVRTLALGIITALPTEFPKVGNGTGDAKYLARTDLGTVYLHSS